jgi:hypothetical protein
MKIRSYSGDWYEIPLGKEHEADEYRKAVKLLDECKMMDFEEGESGWVYLPNG